MLLRLHSWLVLWNLLIVGLISAILAYFLTYSLRDHIQQQLEEQLLRQTSLIAEYLRGVPEDAPLDEVTERLSQKLGLRVTIIAHDGRVLGDSDVGAVEPQSAENQRFSSEIEAAEQIGTGSAVRRSTPTGNSLYVARKVDPYVVRLAMPLTGLSQLMSDIRSQLMLAMLIAVGLTVVFGYVVNVLISRPLRQMATASQRLAAGDLQQRLPISGYEEIGALGNSLNTMAKSLATQMQELSEGKQRLELIVGAMSEGVIVLDRQGRISLFNRAVRSMVGTDRELLGKTLLDVFRRQQLDQAVRNVLKGGSAEVVEIVTGNSRTVQANVAPVVDASGVVDSVVVVFHDLTDIRRTERMRRDFVANVSHEFKTPLTSIRGYAETLLSGALQDQALARDFLEIIERNAQNLEALVTDLLVLGRLEAELPASKEPVDLKALVDDQIRSRQASITDRGLRVINECSSVEVWTDRSRLSTALSNLIDNAIHYNKPNGEIRIHGLVAMHNFQLTITDTGQGIPAHELPRIFERFYRLDKARSRESGGTGLGLSIVKHAIESQGGSISVSSRLGVGACFTIELPLGKEGAESSE
jgi:two-component system phosphate regulon sensor histidine kinase PhoR